MIVVCGPSDTSPRRLGQVVLIVTGTMLVDFHNVELQSSSNHFNKTKFISEKAASTSADSNGTTPSIVDSTACETKPLFFEHLQHNNQRLKDMSQLFVKTPMFARSHIVDKLGAATPPATAAHLPHLQRPVGR